MDLGVCTMIFLVITEGGPNDGHVEAFRDKKSAYMFIARLGSPLYDRVWQVIEYHWVAEE